MKTRDDWDRTWDEAIELVEQDKHDADAAQLALLDKQTPDKENDDDE